MDTLKIEQNPKQKTIAEALGMSQKMYEKIHATTVKLIGLETVESLKKDKDQEYGSKTAIWQRVLETKEFKALKWTPKTANDYFLLGYIINCAQRHAEQMIKEFIVKQATETLGKLPGVHIEVVHEHRHK